MATSFPKFDLRDFPDTSIRNPELVKAKLSEAMTAVGARDREIERLAQNNQELDQKVTETSRLVEVNNTELQSLRKELATEASRAQDLEKKFTEASRTVAVGNTEIQALRRDLALEVGRAQDLKERLDQVNINLPKISVQDLVSQFKGNIDRINAEVISRRTDGMLVDNVEVEVRGGIDVSNGLHISQLPASALGANSASVLRFNLRPSSPLKIVDDDEPG